MANAVTAYAASFKAVHLSWHATSGAGKILELHPRTQGVPDNRPKRKGPAMFTDKTIAEIAAVANELGIEPATLIAVAEVESGGKAFASVETRLEPLPCAPQQEARDARSSQTDPSASQATTRRPACNRAAPTGDTAGARRR